LIARYKSAELAIIGTTFFTEGGDWRSICTYARKAEADGRRIVLVNPRDKRGWRQTLAVWAFAPRVIVNALASFDSWLVLAMCLARHDVRIYLHETEHALGGYKTTNPLRYRLLKRVFRRNPILCVSRKAEALYREQFGANKTHVVYECTGVDGYPKLDPAKVNIVNVGSLNERKGVGLFSKVADLAKERHPDWQFHWVGGLATMNNLYRSPAVKWHGFTWHPSEFVKGCNLFFLSSVDDPCPLSALEALQSGVGCVAFANTGTAELVANVSGCAVFESYNEQAALHALEDALASLPSDRAAIKCAASRASLAAFADAIEAF